MTKTWHWVVLIIAALIFVGMCSANPSGFAGPGNTQSSGYDGG